MLCLGRRRLIYLTTCETAGTEREAVCRDGEVPGD